MIQPELFDRIEGHSAPNQAAAILDFLRRGYSITALDALRLFQCNRLAARVCELKRRGEPIVARWRRLDNGKRVAEYSLV